MLDHSHIDPLVFVNFPKNYSMKLIIELIDVTLLRFTKPTYKSSAMLHTHVYISTNKDVLKYILVLLATHSFSLIVEVVTAVSVCAVQTRIINLVTKEATTSSIVNSSP